MAITTEQIHSIADELHAAGQTPTLAAVRSALNGGSYTTISEAMKDWRAARMASSAPLQEPPPESVQAKFTEAWSAALEMANARLAIERENLEKTRVEIEASRAEAVELADQLSRELEESRLEIEAAQSQLTETRTSNGALKDEIAQVKVTLATANEQRSMVETQLEEAAARANKLEQQLEQARSDATAAKELAAELRGTVKGLEQALGKRKV